MTQAVIPSQGAPPEVGPDADFRVFTKHSTQYLMYRRNGQLVLVNGGSLGGAFWETVISYMEVPMRSEREQPPPGWFAEPFWDENNWIWIRGNKTPLDRLQMISLSLGDVSFARFSPLGGSPHTTKIDLYWYQKAEPQVCRPPSGEPDTTRAARVEAFKKAVRNQLIQKEGSGLMSLALHSSDICNLADKHFGESEVGKQ